MQEEETWKSLPGDFKYYKFSSLDRCKSIDKSLFANSSTGVEFTKTIKGRMLKVKKGSFTFHPIGEEVKGNHIPGKPVSISIKRLRKYEIGQEL